jgi:hypothetical protein
MREAIDYHLNSSAHAIVVLKIYALQCGRKTLRRNV